MRFQYDLGQQGSGGSMAGEGLFSRLLERAIEGSLRRSGNHPVNIFTQILQSLPESDRCLSNAIVRLDYYEQNQIQFGIPEGWMLVAIQSSEDAPLLVCKVQTDVLPPSNNIHSNSFVAQCIGCGRQLDSYDLFCEHFRMGNRPREQILKYYCLFNAETKVIQSQAEGRLAIPWSSQEQVKEEKPTATLPAMFPASQRILDEWANPLRSPGKRSPAPTQATIEELPNTIIVVPQSILDENKRGSIAIMNCTGSPLNLQVYFLQ